MVPPSEQFSFVYFNTIYPVERYSFIWNINYTFFYDIAPSKVYLFTFFDRLASPFFKCWEVKKNILNHHIVAKFNAKSKPLCLHCVIDFLMQCVWEFQYDHILNYLVKSLLKTDRKIEGIQTISVPDVLPQPLQGLPCGKNYTGKTLFSLQGTVLKCSFLQVFIIIGIYRFVWYIIYALSM